VLTRRAPLRRKKPLRSKSLSASRKRRDAARDFPYLAWVRAQGCVVGVDCAGPTHAHHSTAVHRGLSRKAHDRESFGLCARHHDEFHRAFGFCRDWDRPRRREWQRAEVSKMQARYARTEAA
jgi:hypothetical protein